MRKIVKISAVNGVYMFFKMTAGHHLGPKVPKKILVTGTGTKGEE